MKKWKKVTLISGIALILSGAVIGYIGQVSGGLDGILQENRGQVSHVEKKLDQFDKIDLEGNYYDIQVKTTTDKEASISYYTSKKATVDFKVTDKTLNLKQSTKGGVHFFNLSLLADLANHKAENLNTIVISLPKGQSLTSIKSKLWTHGLKLDNLTVKRLDADVDTGSLSINSSTIGSGQAQLDTGAIDIENSQVSNFSMTNGTGSIDISDVTLTSSKISVDTGSLNGENLTFKKDNQISADTGSIDLSLKDYHLTVSSHADTGSSNISDKLIPSKENFLDLKADTGSINLE